MKKDSMVIYREWKIALIELSPEERCFAWEAIMDYAFDGKIPEDKFLKVVTAMMRQRIDKDQSHYADSCNKRAEAGRLGGLKSGETRRRKLSKANEAKASDASSAKQMLPLVEATKQMKQNEHDYDYDNDIYALNKFKAEYIRAREKILKDWMNHNQIDLDAYCMKEYLSIEDFKKYALEVFTEWSLAGWDAKDLKVGTGEYSAMHLLNAVRIKIKIAQNKNQNEINQQDKFQRRRSTDASSWSEEEFEKSF